MRVLRELPRDSPVPAPQPIAPYATTTLDYSLLQSSPSEPVGLSRSNKWFTYSLREHSDVVSPVERYAERITCLCETQNEKIATQAKHCSAHSSRSPILYFSERDSLGILSNSSWIPSRDSIAETWLASSGHIHKMGKPWPIWNRWRNCMDTQRSSRLTSGQTNHYWLTFTVWYV